MHVLCGAIAHDDDLFDSRLLIEINITIIRAVVRIAAIVAAVRLFNSEYASAGHVSVIIAATTRSTLSLSTVVLNSELVRRDSNLYSTLGCTVLQILLGRQCKTGRVRKG